MADGAVVIEFQIDDSEALKDLEKLKRRIKTLSGQIDIKTSLRDPFEEQARQMGAQLDAAKAVLESMRTAPAGQFPIEQIAMQAETVKSMQAEWNKVQSRVESYDAGISKANSEMDLLKKKAGEIEAALAAAGVNTERMASATRRASKSASGFTRQLKFAMSSILLYGTLFQMFSQLTEWIGKVIQANDEASAAVGRLKGALLTLVQPIVNVVIPAITLLADVLARMISVIGAFVSMLFGSTAQASADAAENLYNEASAIGEVGAAAKKAGKQLASFDEINKLSGDTAGSGAGAEVLPPDFSEAGDLSWLETTLGKASGWVTAALLLGGIALVAIGAATGRLSLVLAGLLMLDAAIVVGEETGTFEDWADFLGLNNVDGYVTAALLLGGIALIAIGAGSANLPMVIAGIGLLGAGIAYGNSTGTLASWVETLGLENVSEFVASALLLGGIALVAIGAIIGNVMIVVAGLGLLGAAVAVAAASGNIGSWAEKLGLDTVFSYVVAAIQLAGIALIAIGAALGNIAMVISGAVLLAAGVTAEIIGEETLSSWWEVLKLTTVQQWVSVALLLGGIALVAIGAATSNILMLLIGLGMIGFGAVVGTQNGNLGDWVATLGLEKAAGWVTAGLLIGGIALVVFGILTANILMVLAGLGLLGAGITVGVTSGAFEQWLGTISDAFSSFAGTVKDTFDWLWSGIRGVINAILGGIEGMANGAINGINFVIDALNRLSFTIPDWVPEFGGKSFGFQIQRLDNVEIPRLARGAVIPPNREFLAVLGDQRSGYNYEVPDDKLRQLIREEMGGQAVRELRLVVTAKGSLVRDLKFELDRETQRQGVSLVKGAVT